MNKVQDFFKQLYEGTLYFDAHTVKSLNCTPEEALKIYDLVRTKIVDEKNNKILINPQVVIFLTGMCYFGVTGEVFKNHLETKYNYGK